MILKYQHLGQPPDSATNEDGCFIKYVTFILNTGADDVMAFIIQTLIDYKMSQQF